MPLGDLLINISFICRPFRIYDPNTQNESYDRVMKLSKGNIYQQVGFVINSNIS